MHCFIIKPCVVLVHCAQLCLPFLTLNNLSSSSVTSAGSNVVVVTDGFLIWWLRFSWLVDRAGATIRRTMRLPRALDQRRRQNYNCMVQQVTNVHQKKGMNMMKVNETHESCSLWEDKGTTLFHVCCRRVNVFPINFNFTYTRFLWKKLIRFLKLCMLIDIMSIFPGKTYRDF